MQNGPAWPVPPLAQRLLPDEGTTLFAGAAGAGIDLADVRDLHLLTAKPFLYVFNCDVASLDDTALRESLCRASAAFAKTDLPGREDRGGAGRAAGGGRGRKLAAKVELGEARTPWQARAAFTHWA